MYWLNFEEWQAEKKWGEDRHMEWEKVHGDLLSYLTSGEYDKDFDITQTAMFNKIMEERLDIQREHFKDEWYNFMKYKLPELFSILEKDPERYKLIPNESGETFNIEVKIW